VVDEDETHYRFSALESGPEFTRIDKERVFKFMQIIAEEDTLKNIGSGIGLSQIHKIVEKSGGAVEIETKAGLNSKFAFTMGKGIIET
jgi:light-regulated signal transduction histidine kinase (bacteriophytochrome)